MSSPPPSRTPRRDAALSTRARVLGVWIKRSTIAKNNTHTHTHAQMSLLLGCGFCNDDFTLHYTLTSGLRMAG
jgi:hypothetical protein